MPLRTRSTRSKNKFPTLTPAQQAVYRFLKARGPLTDAELTALYPTDAASIIAAIQTDSGLRTRRAELVKKGYVVRAGTKLAPSNRTINRWKAL
jgi:hypothetical protein